MPSISASISPDDQITCCNLNQTIYQYKTPWIGDPRVNIQNSKGQAKAYQVKQVLKAIERLEVEHGTEK
jgi:hypothetical protein